MLVWDRGPGGSDDTIRELAAHYPWVKPVWLSRNFGQHAATNSGMTSSGGDSIFTINEDGHHASAAISGMRDRAYAEREQLVYSKHASATFAEGCAPHV